MHLWLVFILGLFTLCGEAAAQTTPRTYHADRTTAHVGNTLIIGNYATAGVKIAGSGTFEVTFQVLSYNTQIWDDLKCRNVTAGTESTTADAAGSWQCPVSGFGEFRVNLTTCTGCSVTVTGYGTQAASRSSGGGGGSGVASSITGSSTLPEEPCTINQVYGETVDGVSTFYFCGDGTWTPVNAQTTPNLQSVADIGRTIGNATSPATAVAIGSTADDEFQVTFRDSASGMRTTCLKTGVLDACNKGHLVKDGFRFFIEDESSNKLIDFEPNAATPKEQYALGSKKILKYAYISARSFVGDGTNCPLTASAVTINSGPKTYTMICGSGANGDMDFNLVMPRDWDGGTLLFEPSYTQTAANTSAMNSDIKAQCRGAGETPSSTWGGSVAIDDAAVTGSSAEDKTLSAAVTPAGTCAAGDHLYVRYTLDVTGTTTPEATLHFYGVGLYYFASSLSN